ncbi:hypothetical protein HYU11_04050 [Candidatus Woesearchaeota archaeon]|nr:hypothetical protein [Candidatus Woesearchaeota archaeon]
MKKYFALLLLIAVFLTPSASARLSCRTANLSAGDFCNNEITLINMTDWENAHPSLPNAIGANNKVSICCKGAPNLSTSRNTIAWLSDASNGHASTNTTSAYPINLTWSLFIASSPVLASSVLDNANTTCLNANYDACAFSLSDFDDAHVGDCFNYKQSGLAATGGRVYALCLNATCYENSCENGFKCVGGDWRMLDSDGNGVDDGCDGPTSDCNSSFFSYCPSGNCRGCVNGTVTGIDLGLLTGAKVETIPFANSSTTRSDGSYLMAVPENNYTLIASRGAYTPDIRNLFIKGGNTTTVNFLLGYGPNDCNSDCTRQRSNGKCDKSCQGTNGCTFYDSASADACHDWKSGFRRPYPGGKEVLCCEGDPYEPRTGKLNISRSGNSTVIARATKMVWFEGKFVKMVIDVFG